MKLLRRLMREFDNWVNGNKDVVKLWLDDERPAPRGWYWATTVDEALDVLMSCYVQELSLDHDLGMGFGKEGVDLVKAIIWFQEVCSVNIWPEQRPTIHSMNPVGRSNMEADIDRYGPYNKEKRQ